MLSFLNNIRVLPVTIFVAAFLLTIKVTAIWDGVDAMMSGGVEVSSAQADQKQNDDRPQTLNDVANATRTAAAKPLEMAQANTGDQELTEEERQALAEEDAAIQAEDAARPEPDLADDPTFYTQAEVDLLQKLAERREEIEAQAREVDIREQLLKAAEARIDKKVQSLKALQRTIEDMMVKYDQEQEEKLVNLVKIYENMKPKDAGRIFEELEMDVLLEVAEKMNKRRLAPILAKMDPKKARDVTEELFRLRSLPKPGEIAGGG